MMSMDAATATVKAELNIPEYQAGDEQAITHAIVLLKSAFGRHFARRMDQTVAFYLENRDVVVAIGELPASSPDIVQLEALGARALIQAAEVNCNA